MRLRLAIIGTGLLLLGASMGAAAYHITGALGAMGQVESAHKWRVRTTFQLDGPSVYVYGLVVCERDDFIGLGPRTKVSTPGIGGLCYMSAGHSGDPCTADAISGAGTDGVDDGGRSNGHAPDYASVGACPSGAAPLPAATVTVTQWFTIHMLDQDDADVRFFGQVDGHDCLAVSVPPTKAFTYDDQYAYTTDDGHVVGFPVADALVPDLVPDPDPLDLGTYEVVGNSSSGSACDPLFPYFDQV